MKRVAVLDPGRCKCGLVLADLQLGLVREGHVLAPEAVEPWLEHWNQDQALDRILIGDGTGSAVAGSRLATDAAGRTAHSTGGSGCCCSFGDA